ncbi:RNA polymerase subunit sigma-70 [Rossellomorea marisflavi]
MNSTSEKALFQTDFHQFMEMEKGALNMELASEFGLTLKDVRLLKKNMERS